MGIAGHPTAQPYSRAGLLAKLTGAAALAAGAMLFGNATGQLQALTLGTAGRVIVAGASSPAWSDSGLSYASSVLTIAGSVPGTPAAGQVAIGGGAIKAGGAITADGVVSCQGLQNTVGDFTSRADEDAQTILGRIRCGFFTGLGDNASFSHYDFATSSSYSLRQDSAGATAINSATGQSTTIRVNNTIVLAVAAASIVASQNLTVPNGTAGAPGIRTTTYAHGLYSVDASNLGFSAAGALCMSVAAPNGSTVGSSLLLRTPSAGERAIVNISLNTSYLQLASDPSLSGGGLKLYGPSHATKPNVVEFLVVGVPTATFNASGIFTTVATTDASAIGTAAIVGPGGLSIAKSIYCAGSAGQFINIANSTGELRVNGTKVMGARKTGWTVPTGTATRTAFDTTTVTTEQLAERVKALIDDFHSTAGHGAIGT